MNVRLITPLFMSSEDHNYNAALRLYGPPAMFSSDVVPALPPNAVTETSRETLARLKHDLVLIEDHVISAGDEYRMYIEADSDIEQPFWGYCLETAQVDETKDIFVLVCNSEGRTGVSTLCWLPMRKVLTRKLAYLRYKVVDDDGPSEDVVIQILQLLREAFEYAVEDTWSYRERLGFYHAFPFDELDMTEAVQAFRPVLFGCPAFAGIRAKMPEAE